MQKTDVKNSPSGRPARHSPVLRRDTSADGTGRTAARKFGLAASTAGKAGFITGLYVVLVPILGLFLSQRAGWGTWVGAALAVTGMYLLSVTSGVDMAFGDLLVLGSAISGLDTSCWSQTVSRHGCG